MRKFATVAASVVTVVFAHVCLAFISVFLRALYDLDNPFTWRLTSPLERALILFLPAAATGAICGAVSAWAVLGLSDAVSPRGLRYIVAAYFAFISLLGIITIGSQQMPPDLAFFSLTRAVAVTAAVWAVCVAHERRRSNFAK